MLVLWGAISSAVSASPRADSSRMDLLLFLLHAPAKLVEVLKHILIVVTVDVVDELETKKRRGFLS